MYRFGVMSLLALGLTATPLMAQCSGGGRNSGGASGQLSPGLANSFALQPSLMYGSDALRSYPNNNALQLGYMNQQALLARYAQQQQALTNAFAQQVAYQQQQLEKRKAAQERNAEAAAAAREKRQQKYAERQAERKLKAAKKSDDATTKVALK